MLLHHCRFVEGHLMLDKSRIENATAHDIHIVDTVVADVEALESRRVQIAFLVRGPAALHFVVRHWLQLVVIMAV